MNQNKLQIFLCHASEDKPFVRDLYYLLKKAKFTPWLDEFDLIPGQEWESEIPKAVIKSDCIIIVLSPNSINKRGYYQKEIRIALNQAEKMPQGSIFIIPLIIEKCSIPDSLSRWQWLDFTKNNSKKKLLDTLNTLSKSNQIASSNILINQIAVGITNGIYKTAKHYKRSISDVSKKLIWLYWKIGQIIFLYVEKEHLTPSKIISGLSLELTKAFGKGYSQDNLFNMYTFYKLFKNPEAIPANITWAHCNIVMKLTDEDTRWFYLIEAAKNQWSSRQLQKNIDKSKYGRKSISSEKEYDKFISDPYIFEFLSLRDKKDSKLDKMNKSKKQTNKRLNSDRFFDAV